MFKSLRNTQPLDIDFRVFLEKKPAVWSTSNRGRIALRRR